MAVDTVAQMKKFIEPESVAVFGVPRTPMTIGKMPVDVLTTLLSHGYRGRIYPIHPRASEIRGIKAYSSVADVTEKIDLAIINLPRDLVPRLIKDCINKDIKAITIVTQGFADGDDDEGKRLQKEIDDIARATGTRILGPNTFGTANAYINFTSAYLETNMERIPAGFMCQTGAFFAGLPNIKLMGKAVDIGNSSDVDFSDGLEYFEQDDEIKVVGLHVEGVKDATRFLQVARRVALKKPLVILKVGRNEWTAKAVQSHTGSLVGEDEIWDVALKQAGVTRVNDVEELSDTIKAFYALPLMRGRRIGIVTYSGGLGIIGMDACQKYGLEVAQFSPATIDQLGALYPSWQKVGNPADIWPAAGVAKKATLFEIQERTIKTLLDDPGVDAVLCIFAAYDTSLEVACYRIAEEVSLSHPNKPLVFYLYGPSGAEAAAKLDSKGRPLGFASPVRAIRALGHLADYSEFRKRC